MGRRYYTITDIVSSVYCEQKTIFDRECGDKRPMSVRVKAVTGSFEHLRFQAEGYSRAVADRRCFIASAVYGEAAPETEFLRLWRDRCLMHSWLGRLAVRGYYAISPRVAPILAENLFITEIVKAILDRFVSLLGIRK